MMNDLWLCVRGVEDLVLIMVIVMVFGLKGGGGGCRNCYLYKIKPFLKSIVGWCVVWAIGIGICKFLGEPNLPLWVDSLKEVPWYAPWSCNGGSGGDS